MLDNWRVKLAYIDKNTIKSIAKKPTNYSCSTRVQNHFHFYAHNIFARSLFRFGFFSLFWPTEKKKSEEAMKKRFAHEHQTQHFACNEQDCIAYSNQRLLLFISVCPSIPHLSESERRISDRIVDDINIRPTTLKNDDDIEWKKKKSKNRQVLQSSRKIPFSKENRK